MNSRSTLAFVVVLLLAAAAPAGADEKAFLAENEAAMATMMQGMAIQPTGDVDKEVQVD